MKKIGSILALVCVLNVLAAAGIIAYLFGTGRMNAAKLHTIVSLARQQGTESTTLGKVDELIDVHGAAATTSAPATQGHIAEGALRSASEIARFSAEERLRFADQAMEQERIRLDNQAQDLRHRQELLEQRQAALTLAEQNLDKEKKAFEPVVATADSKAKAENFAKMLALYDELKPKQVKDLFIDSKNHDLAGAYLAAMEASRAAKIIGEFKTPEERTFLDLVMQRMRTSGTASASGTSTTGAVSAGTPAP